MMFFARVVTLFPDLGPVELQSWIEREWVQPEPAGPDRWAFHDIDLARIRLIYDLRRHMGTPEESVALVLSLLDQIYELRSLLKTVSETAGQLPPEGRQLMLSALKAYQDRRH